MTRVRRASILAIALVVVGCGRIGFDPASDDSTYVKPSNTGAGDQFGISLALSGDGTLLAVGAWHEDSAGDPLDDAASDAGAVYVFQRSGATWSQQAYLKASNASANDQFGLSVAISADGTTLAVGAIGADIAGAAYVFTRSGSTWSEQAIVTPASPDTGDAFGNAIALSADGDTLAVGAYSEDSAARGIDGNVDDDSAPDAGAVFVFARAGATWTQQAYVKASNADASDEFGYSVALDASGDTLAVGAFDEASATQSDETNNAAPGSGATYVFTRAATWTQQAYLKASNAERDDEFGRSVALSANGSVLAIGAYAEDGADGTETDNSALGAGAAYVFSRTGSAWSQEAYVKAANAEGGDLFGIYVALSADASRLAVGAFHEDSSGDDPDDNSVTDAGAVYSFLRTGAVVTQNGYLKASNASTGASFGRTIALSPDGRTLGVGAYNEQSGATGVDGDQADQSAMGAGAVYIFR